MASPWRELSTHGEDGCDGRYRGKKYGEIRDSRDASGYLVSGLSLLHCGRCMVGLRENFHHLRHVVRLGQNLAPALPLPGVSDILSIIMSFRQGQTQRFHVGPYCVKETSLFVLRTDEVSEDILFV